MVKRCFAERRTPRHLRHASSLPLSSSQASFTANTHFVETFFEIEKSCSMMFLKNSPADGNFPS